MTRLSRTSIIGLALVATAFMLVPAQAQPPGGRERGRSARRGGPAMDRPAGGNMMGLLRLEQVQKELELVDDQVDKIKELADELRGQVRRKYAGLRDMSPEERRSKMAELRESMKEQAEKMQAKVKEILLPNQLERLNQIHLQMQGARALENKTVIEKLGLSEDQIDELKSLREKIRRKRQSSFGGLRNMAPEERRKLMEELRNMTPEERKAKREEQERKAKALQDEAIEQALGILTSEQHEALQKMQGKKFELDRSALGKNRPGRERGGERGRGRE